MSVHQISIFLENRAGQLAQVTRVLADHAIDMRAISIAETSDYGVLRLIVDNAEKATSVLLENGFILSMTPVSVVAVPDQAGGLAPVLEALAQGHMDVEYMYSLFTHKEGMAYMVFRINDEERFAALLSAHGISLADKEELGLK
ncbi:MAG: ACT domain-containing protein [Clostridia bacterium]|nr:ACT domain-containing protein [Clostridia bacterium]